MPRKTRRPSSLQESGARSLTTNPFGKPTAARRVQLRRRHFGIIEQRAQAAERDQHVVALAHPFDRAALEHGQPVPVVAPGEAVVLQRVVVEDVRAAAPQVEQEEAVAVANLRIDGVGEQVTLPVERDVAHGAKEERASRGEFVNDGIGAARRVRSTWRRRGRRSSAAAPTSCRSTTKDEVRGSGVEVARTASAATTACGPVASSRSSMRGGVLVAAPRAAHLAPAWWRPAALRCGIALGGAALLPPPATTARRRDRVHLVDDPARIRRE